MDCCKSHRTNFTPPTGQTSVRTTPFPLLVSDYPPHSQSVDLNRNILFDFPKKKSESGTPKNKGGRKGKQLAPNRGGGFCIPPLPLGGPRPHNIRFDILSMVVHTAEGIMWGFRLKGGNVAAIVLELRARWRETFYHLGLD